MTTTKRSVELHKLNGDTSWLVRIPLPTSNDNGNDHTDGSSNQDRTFDLVIDPWLHPAAQIDGASCFSKQTRVQQAQFDSIADLDRWLRSRPATSDRLQNTCRAAHDENDQDGHGEGINAVLFSHPFTDHLHPETLQDTASRRVLERATILTTADSLDGLQSLRLDLDPRKIVNLCNSRKTTLNREQDKEQKKEKERASSLFPRVLPTGVTVHYLAAKDWSLSPAWSKLHGGILITVDPPRDSSDASPLEILYAPHGISAKSVSTHFSSVSTNRNTAERKTSNVAQSQLQSELRPYRVLLHSFDRQTLPLIGVVACGFPNIVDLVASEFRPDVVVATHDEHKSAQGLVALTIRRRSFPLDSARRLLASKYPDSHTRLEGLAVGESLTLPLPLPLPLSLDPEL
ncbi:hypothetical protein BCV70DRAFT_201111 [Testicularia cyperi]|uniref:Metallo-beta-lactamase domain-containing protein n=1 Tax=Testicularia cyperi TaxID=1882483 RepID=A0A317XML2_9BASI|nr:hypothetical protein BCV70DRAFT_201111 [Testicularia cyperi]